MADFNGEDLINIFKQLNVQLLTVSPNVVKGWFDTDENNMRNLLKWMCTSLSSENFVSPLEATEFNEIQLLLNGEKLDQEVSVIEERFPDIFDMVTTQFDIIILQDQIQMLIDDEQNLDNLITMNEELERNLTQEWNDKLALEIKTESKLLQTQERCRGLTHKLDEKNAKLQNQLIRYGNNLYKFEFSEQPYFINNIEVKSCNEKYENLTSIVKTFLEDPLLSFSCSIAPSNIFLSTTNVNESLENCLLDLRRSISLSHQLYVNGKIEAEKMKELLEFFSRNSVSSISSLTESVYMQYNLETKEETKRRMLTMLENYSAKMADQHISLTKLKYTQHELEMYQSKLDILSIIEELLLKLVSQYLVLYTLYNQEKEDIECSDKFFRKVIHYINQDLQRCVSSTARMKEIIEEFRCAEPSEKFKFIKTMLRALGINEGFSLNRALEILFDFKNDLNRLQEKVFSCSTKYKIIGKDLKENIQTLKSFLICGPTYRIVSVPYQLLSVIRETEAMLEKQNESIRGAVEITSTKKRNQHKWDIYKRQLWMYFYTEPQKLKIALQQIEEEFLKLKVDSDMI